MYTGTILSRGKFLVMLLLLFSLCSIYIPAQVEWTKYENNPVLLPGSSQEWDEAGFAGQTVLYDSTEGIYKMWYGATDGFNFRIGYATSTDGIEWEKYNDPLTLAHPYADSDPVLGLGPGSFETTRVYFPVVLFDGTIYHMWYIGSGNNVEQVGYATSTDGIAWIKDTLHNPVITPGPFGSWDDVTVGVGPVQYDGTTFEMIYSGFDGSVFQAGYAASTDGFTWNKSPDVVFPVGADTSWDFPRANPTTVTYNPYLSKYYMFYSGGDFGTWKIGYATADSFLGPWTKNPLPIMEGTPGQWDEVTAAFPSILYFPEESLYKMWYMGSNYTIGPAGGKIGYATAWVLDTLYVPNDYASIQQAIDAASDGAVVLVDEGTYMENINFRGKAITVASRFFVDGDTSHIYNTVIDGSQPADPDSGSVVTFNSGEDTNSVICGFTITGGSGTLGYNSYYGTWDKFGGGITATDGCRISHNIITQNEITRTTANSNAYGAGISCSANTIIEFNNINNNNLTCALSQAAGAGVVIAGSGTRLVNNYITDNTAISNASNWNANGGGVAIVFSNVLISGNYIARNKALAPNCTIYPCYGGGFHAFETVETVSFYNNIIIENIAEGAGGSYGGGINFIDGNTPDIKNNVIVRNQAFRGGGISCISNTSTQSPKILNNTVSLNSASTGRGGAIYSSGSWTPLVINSIFWDNTTGTGSEVYGNFDISYTDVEGGYQGTGNADWDPYFRDTTINDFHLMSTDCGDSENSACIDAGHPGYLDDILDCTGGLGDSTSDMGAYGGTKVVVGVEEQYLNIPTEYSLNQNYPNPFNPSTTIRYSVPRTSLVQIKIYDVLGNEIKTLINEEKPAGTYELNWNAVNLTSGVYFYQIRAGEFTGTKKMILLK